MEALFSRIFAHFGALFSRLGVLLSLAAEQSRWDWQTFLMWGQVIAFASLGLALFSLLLYALARLVVWNTKRQVNDMRHLFKLMREGYKTLRAEKKGGKGRD